MCFLSIFFIALHYFGDELCCFVDAVFVVFRNLFTKRIMDM